MNIENMTKEQIQRRIDQLPADIEMVRQLRKYADDNNCSGRIYSFLYDLQKTLRTELHFLTPTNVQDLYVETLNDDSVDKVEEHIVQKIKELNLCVIEIPETCCPEQINKNEYEN